MQPVEAAELRLVGRDDELQAFARLIENVATRGEGGLFSVIGDAGIGKTTLLRSFAQSARSAGLRTVEWACWPGQGAPPLWVWDELLGEFRVPRPNSSEGAQLERFSAMSRVFEEVGADSPVVVVLEDLHLADLETILFVRFLARSIGRLPLVLVVSWRASGPGLTDELAMVAADSTERVDLRRLTAPEVADVLDGYPALDAQARARCIDLCGGNPLFVHELARSLAAGEDRIPPSVAQIIDQRLTALDSPVRAVLLAAGVLGSRSVVGEVAMLAGVPNSEVADLELRSSGLARIDGSRVGFQHEVVREVLIEGTPSAELIRLHQAAVGVLSPAQTTSEACRVAEHAAAAGVESVEAAEVAVRACREAADRARKDGGFHRAAELLALAVAARDVHPQLSAEPTLLVEHAEAVLATGRLDDARACFDLAVTAADRAGDPVALARAAVGLGGVWVEEARDAVSRDRLLQLLRRSIHELPAAERVLHARLQVRLAAELRYQGESEVDDVRTAVEHVRSFGDDFALGEALSLFHHVMLTPPYAHERLGVAEELAEVAARSGDELHAVVARCWLTVDLYLLGEERADRSLDDFRAHAGAIGCHSMDYIVAVLDAMCALRDGRLDEAEALGAAAFALGSEVGDADAFGYYGGHLMALRWVQGRVGEIREMVEELANSATLRTHDVVFAAAAAAAAALDGDRDGTERWLRGTRVGSAATVPLFSTWTTAMMALTETAWLLDDVELAEQVLPLIEPFADLPVRASLAVTCLGPTRRLVGLLHVTAGRLDQGIETLRVAIRECRELRNRPVEVILHAELAEALRRRGETGDRAEARLLVDQALTQGAELEMTGRLGAWAELKKSLDGVGAQTPGSAQEIGVLEYLSGQWRVSVDGRELWVRDSVGLRHMAALLANESRPLSALELSVAEGGSPELWEGEPLIDETARRAYSARMAELEADLREAEANADLGWAERLRREHDELAQHLASATGIDGRDRRSSDARERARTRVSKAIRRAIRHVGEADPMLGDELDRTVRTGHYCHYETDPVHPREWLVRSGDRPAG